MGYYRWLLKPDPRDRLPVLPPYPRINLDAVPAGAALLWMGGGPYLTGKQARVLLGYPHRNHYFHASLALGQGEHLNQGKKAVIEPIAEQYQSTQRIDVVIYRDLPEDAAERFQEWAKTREGRRYDYLGFLWQGLKIIRPSSYYDFCSQQVITAHRVIGHQVSYRFEEWSAPTHIWFYAVSPNHPGLCEMRTLHLGRDFKP